MSKASGWLTAKSGSGGRDRQLGYTGKRNRHELQKPHYLSGYGKRGRYHTDDYGASDRVAAGD